MTDNKYNEGKEGVDLQVADTILHPNGEKWVIGRIHEHEGANYRDYELRNEGTGEYGVLRIKNDELNEKVLDGKL